MSHFPVAPGVAEPVAAAPALEAPLAAVPAEGRVVLLLTSPRVAAGLLSRDAWQRLQEAHTVLGADVDPAWVQALAEAGIAVQDLAGLPIAQRAGRLLDATDGGSCAVWLGGADGDPGLTDALAEHLSRRAVAARPPEVEMVTGSHDVTGARLLDLVAVMDRLRSPGGCPWDAEQTHVSLLPYLLEETHEVIESVESADRDHLREELGDLLLQVVFHARLAQEHPLAPFDVDDVAAGIVEKLVRRHPHVFADDDAPALADAEAKWEHLKEQEKGPRGLFEGIPPTLPALARAQKMLARLARAQADIPAAMAAVTDGLEPAGVIAAQLLAVVEAARAVDVDAEAALRSVLAGLADQSPS